MACNNSPVPWLAGAGARERAHETERESPRPAGPGTGIGTNRPTPDEQQRCLPYLVRELQLLRDLRVIVPLGSIGWAAALRAIEALGHPVPRPRPRFGHGAEAGVGPWIVLGSYHPSQQNTFTGRLTQPMLQAVLARARELAGLPPVVP